MNILILLLYGFVLSLSIITYDKISIKKANSMHYSPKAEYFVLFFFAFTSFCTIFSFPYIGNGVKDMVVYKISYEAQKYKFSYRQSLFNQSQEPLYALLVFLLSKVISFRCFLFFVYTFIFCSIRYYMEKFDKTFSWIFLFLFVGCYFSLIITSFCLLRMVLATSVGLFALKQIEYKSWGKALLIVVLAVGIHFTAIFFTFPLFLAWVKTRWNKLFGMCFFLSFCVGLAFVKVVNSILPSFNARYSSYQQSGLSFSLFAMKSYLLNIVFLFFVYLKRRVFFR